jgi:hypothetical protein
MNEIRIRSLAASMLFALLGASGCAAQAEEDQPNSPTTGALGDPGGGTDPDDSQVTKEADKVSPEDLEKGKANSAGMETPDPVEGDGILENYPNVDTEKVVPKRLLENALNYYDKNKSKLENSKYLTVIDMATHSRERRFFLIDMESGKVERHVVAHGKGSDPEHDGTPRLFSNEEGSLMTSLGFYKTAETYDGSNGYSLRLDGLSRTNSNARERAVVVHGASYVVDGADKQGRSWGCPALPNGERTAVINKIKNGSILYIDRSTTP